MVTDRKLTGELILVVVVAWVVGLLMSASIPYGLGIEVGSLAAVLWGWSDRSQMVVLITGAIIVGVMAHFNQFMVLATVPVGIGLVVLGRYFGVGFPEFEARTSGGRIRPYRHHVFLCYGERCQLRGADLLLKAMDHSPDWKIGRGVRVTTSECLGSCQQGPVLWIEPEGTLSKEVRLRDLPQFFDKDAAGRPTPKDTR